MKAVALHVFIKDKGAKDSDPISVEHVFYGATEKEADAKRLKHMSGCENYARAEVEERTCEEVEDIADVDVPTWDLVGGAADEGDDADDEEVIDVEGEEVDEEK